MTEMQFAVENQQTVCIGWAYDCIRESDRLKSRLKQYCILNWHDLYRNNIVAR